MKQNLFATAWCIDYQKWSTTWFPCWGSLSICALSQFEAAAREVVKEHRVFNEDGTEPTAEEVQVLMYSSSRFGPHSLRDLTVSRLQGWPAPMEDTV